MKENILCFYADLRLNSTASQVVEGANTSAVTTVSYLYPQIAAASLPK
jgi:hypothetical protein